MDSSATVPVAKEAIVLSLVHARKSIALFGTVNLALERD